MRQLVAGIDSGTQSVKVVVRDAATGELVRHGRAAHPSGTEVDPEHWWSALQRAIADAGGVDDVAMTSVAAQQHGMVALDASGAVVRPALLWNDTRSAGAATDLVAERGAAAWATAVGSVPVASFTVTKLRWLAEHEPERARRTEAVCLPHDWLTWRLAGNSDLDALTTDRSDASGTGYWTPATGAYREDLLEAAFGRALRVPRVLGPADRTSARLAAGAGDNAAAALALGARPGDVVLSLGTSGVVSAVSATPTADATGLVAGLADATGHFLPLACTLNGAPVLDAAARLLGVGHAELDRLALSQTSDGLVLVPYLEGERTPDLPAATGALHGLTQATSTPGHLARAAVEGLLCHLADALDALVAQGVAVDRVLLVGGGASSQAVCRLAPSVLGRPVHVPAPGEYVADGAAVQAAWALSGTRPSWELNDVRVYDDAHVPQVRRRYAEVRDRTDR